MNGFLGTAVLALFLVPVLLVLLFRRGRSDARTGYLWNPTLFSPEQRMLHAALKQAIGSDYEIMAGVRVGDLIAPRTGTSRGPAHAAFEELAERPFTFVLCRSTDLSVAGAITLAAHGRRGSPRSKADEALVHLCEEVGLPLISIEAAPLYDVAELRGRLFDALEPTATAAPTGDGRKEPHISSFDDLDLE